MSKGNYVALFHGVHARHFGIHPQAQRDLLMEDFIRIIEWLEKRFTFITPEELLKPGKTGGVLLTFDDGLKNNYRNVIPYLHEKGIPALFFISTQHIIDPHNWLWFARERAAYQWNDPAEVPEEIAEELFDGMSLQELKAAVAGFPNVYIGAHTVSHPDLPDLSQEEVLRELVDSRDWLREQTGQAVEYFAYPRGLFGNRDRELVSQHFKAAFAVDQFENGDPFAIPRVSVHSAGRAYLELKFSPLHKPPYILSP